MLFDPIIECVYGWGQVMRLYDDHLDIDGTSYALADLISVHPIYYQIWGVSSARLDLRFKQKRVILRGIAATETAQRTASYLSSFCHLQTAETEIPLFNTSHVDHQWPKNTTKVHEHTDEVLQIKTVQPPDVTNTVAYSRVTAAYTQEQPHKTSLFSLSHWRLIGQEQRQRRKKRIQAERAHREHGFDVEQLTLRLQTPILPKVYVPTRLLNNECAHYYTHATLCEEPFPGAKQPIYRAKDQGMLILTDKRMIYIGRRRQLVLDYSRLLHVSHLQGAIAVMSETWAQRELFEIRFPLECTMYLDAILLRYHKEPWNRRTSAKVRQLYPSTETRSYDMPITTNHTHPEAITQWRSSGLSNR